SREPLLPLLSLRARLPAHPSRDRGAARHGTRGAGLRAPAAEDHQGADAGRRGGQEHWGGGGGVSPARGRPALPDAEARRRAVTTFDRNLVVVAGAGTGKTALLVERALNLIGTGRIPIAALAAITFSDKAAAELRQRLARGLDELRALALASAPPAA